MRKITACGFFSKSKLIFPKQFHVIFSLLFLLIIGGCGQLEAMEDNCQYESITGAKGTVFVKISDSLSKKYEHATIVYSEADATTMLIKTEEGRYVYIQGPCVVEFDELNANP